jgi:hypothetical protein
MVRIAFPDTIVSTFMVSDGSIILVSIFLIFASAAGVTRIES